MAVAKASLPMRPIKSPAGDGKLKDSVGNVIPKTAIILRASELNSFRDCRRRWFLSSHNGLNLEPVMRDKKLSEGICWHGGMESHYAKGDFSVGFEQEFAKELEKMQQVIGAGVYDEVIQADLDERRERAYALFDKYKEWASTEAYPPDNEFEVVGVEKRLLVPIPTPSGTKSRAWIAARLDGLVKYEGIYFVLEHKYVSKSTRVDNPEGLELDLQMGAQIWALQSYLNHALPGNPIVGGALYNLTRKQMPSKRVRAPLFGRHLVTRSQKELTLLLHGIHKDSLDMRRCQTHPQERTYNPQKTGMCSWGCAFRSVCEAMNRGEDVDLLLDSGFQKRQKSIWQMLEEEMKGD